MLSSSVQAAWRDGKFNAVAFNGVKWYDYTDRLNRHLRLHGTWELAFAKFLDDEGYEFDVHPKCMEYFDAGGKRHLYFPDFFVKGWKDKDAFLDTKNEFIYLKSIEKFECIRRDNPDVNIIIIREHELKELGVI
jgi:hypothetical protein